LSAITRGGYSLFTETVWSGYEKLVGRTLVMDKADCVWECVQEDFGCLAFVGLWNGEEMIPIELCSNEE